MDCLKKIKPCIPILYKLIIDLVLMGYDVIRQVILPNRRRKGNLLSSLFLLFVGLTDHLVTFGQTLTKAPWTAPRWTTAPWVTTTLTYGKKYIRQGMLIVTWALFILSSFEWSSPAQAHVLAAQNQQQTTESVQLTVKQAKATSTAPRRLYLCVQPTALSGISYLSPRPSPRPTAKTWLRLCTLRI